MTTTEPTPTLAEQHIAALAEQDDFYRNNPRYDDAGDGEE
jgi:hypothetical protein